MTSSLTCRLRVQQEKAASATEMLVAVAEQTWVDCKRAVALRLLRSRRPRDPLAGDR